MTMTKQAYPYCIHGHYVGGCGADYMCFSCEMGDEAPTVNDLRYDKLRAARNFVDRLAFSAQMAFKLVAVAPGAIEYIRHNLVEDFEKMQRAQNRIDMDIAEVLTYTDDPDDADWIYARNAERIREWDEANGDEQFWSLPDEVLDGP